MIDAFYQSLVCFFIPYFVSLVSISVSCRLFSWFLSLADRLFSPSSPPQAYADSDVDLFTWGTPITSIALFTILLHLGIETKTWVNRYISNSPMADFLSLSVLCSYQHVGFVSAAVWRLTGSWKLNSG